MFIRIEPRKGKPHLINTNLIVFVEFAESRNSVVKMSTGDIFIVPPDEAHKLAGLADAEFNPIIIDELGMLQKRMP